VSPKASDTPVVVTEDSDTVNDRRIYGMNELGLGYILSTAVYSMLGLMLFIVALYIIEKITHFSISKKVVEEGNVAVSIVVGSIVIAMGIIVSAAIH